MNKFLAVAFAAWLGYKIGLAVGLPAFSGWFVFGVTDAIDIGAVSGMVVWNTIDAIRDSIRALVRP